MKSNTAIGLLVAALIGLTALAAFLIRSDGNSKSSDQAFVWGNTRGGADSGPVEDIVAAMNAGDVAALSAYFDLEVDVTLPGTSELLEAPEVEQVLRQFFSRNPVKSFNLLHRGQSVNGESQYLIGQLSAGEETYRTYLLMAGGKLKKLEFSEELFN